MGMGRVKRTPYIDTGSCVMLHLVVDFAPRYLLLYTLPI